MEVVSMVQRERYLSSILCLLFIIWTGCDTRQAAFLNGDDQRLLMINGMMCFNGKPYTGRLYKLFPSSSDTAEITGYHDGRENGIWKKFYAGARIRERREYEDGIKSGILTAWWEDGRKKLEYRFRKGEYQGTCREWNREGILTREMNYTNGYESGSQKMFYDNGKVRANYVIANGRRYGLLGTKNCVNASDSVFKN